MARGRQRADWERTALLAAVAANPYRDVKKRPTPFTPDDFNPFADRKAKSPDVKIKISVDCLKPLCKNQGLGD